MTIYIQKILKDKIEVIITATDSTGKIVGESARTIRKGAELYKYSFEDLVTMGIGRHTLKT